ncbi:MAG: EF-P lysine aminoacylase EpmA [Desulfobulbus sp.]|nr:EF-P lysine aminoacylase EpmA [Desulfobulbus sp.]
MLSARGLQQRSQLLQAMRSFFYERAYIEVDTPVRLPVLIPESNIIPFTSEGFFLQTSPELCMKRLLARGCDRIFQICHCFRKEELGRLHHSEFTMLEWYHKGWSYEELMVECEALICALAKSFASLKVGGIDNGHVLVCGERQVDLSPPWERLSVAEAFQRYAAMAVDEVLAQDNFDEVLVTSVEPYLGTTKPTFLYDYPAVLGSLARRKPGGPHLAERFELYIAGVELANGFSELADADEQRQRFQQEIDRIHASGGKAGLPEKFLADLPAMGECAGIALGVDRLFMLMIDGATLSDSLPFIFETL